MTGRPEGDPPARDVLLAEHRILAARYDRLLGTYARLRRAHDEAVAGREADRTRLAAALDEALDLRAAHAAVVTSTIWRAGAGLRRVAARLPGAAGLGRRMMRAADRLARTEVPPPDMPLLPAAVVPPPVPTPELDLWELCEPLHDEPGPWADDPAFLVSVVTAVRDAAPGHLRALLQTLRNQTYGGWEWVITGTGSAGEDVAAALRAMAAGEPRMRLIAPEMPDHMWGAVRGTHVAFVAADALVARDALRSVHAAWQGAPEAGLFFTDECELSPDGLLGEFRAKPGWSPAYLEATMWLGDLAVYQTQFLHGLGGFEGAYDLALQAARAGVRAVHVPVFGCVRRAGARARDLDAEGRAVLDHARGYPGATVAPGWAPGFWRIDHPLPDPAPLVSYIIPAGGGRRAVRGQMVDLVVNCIRSFEATAFYPVREYLVVHDGTLPAAQQDALTAIPGVRLIRFAEPSFNFSRTLNHAAALARGSILCLLNDDVEAITPRGGERLVAYLLAHPGAGTIGPLCLREDGTIQQNGIVMVDQVGPVHAGDRQPRNFGGPQGMLRCRREAFCIGGAILFVDAALYHDAGGFPEDLPLNYNDVEFGLRIRARGRTCIVDPDIEVRHFEGATKAGTGTVELERFFLRHPALSDPYLNPRFDQANPNYRLELRKGPPGLLFAPWFDRHIAARAATLVPRGRYRLSVCMTVRDQPPAMLDRTAAAIAMQTYADRELVLVDDGSRDAGTLGWLADMRRGGRAVVTSGDATAAMTGDFMIPVVAGDVLSVDALQVLAHAIEAHPGRVVFYADEYRSDGKSSRSAPFFKPDFDPVLLGNRWYAGHPMAVDAAWLRRAGPGDPVTLAMQAGLEPVHVREVLYASCTGPGAAPHATLARILAAMGVADRVAVEPNPFDAAMWRLRALVPLPGVTILDAHDVWGAGGSGVAGLVAAAASPGGEWVAVLLDPGDDRVMAELSAPALFDERVTVVSGLSLSPAGTMRWSGGVFTGDGRVVDPQAGRTLSSGGLQAALWCQRCVDVAGPVDVLIRASALRRVGERGDVVGSAGLMVALGLDAHARGRFVAVTPHVLTVDPGLPLLVPPTAGAGLPVGHGSRWYDPRLESGRPYRMPGML